MKNRIAFALALCLLSCTKNTALPRNAAAVVRSDGEPSIGTFVSSGDSFQTSSYWIDAPGGLILIDTQFLPSEAEKALQWAEAVTGKKAVLAIVLHPNPDKFNGTATYQKRGIKVITSDQVKAAIPAVHNLRKDWFLEAHTPDYPTEVPVPDSFGNATKEINVAGTTLRLHTLGAGCSEAHVVVEWNGHLFPGDLVTNGFHSWLELGRLDEWLLRMDELIAMHPIAVHPGRGESGDAELLDQEKAYLQEVVATVKAFQPKGPPQASQLEKISAAILGKHPDLKFAKFVENGLEELWKRYAK